MKNPFNNHAVRFREIFSWKSMEMAKFKSFYFFYICTYTWVQTKCFVLGPDVASSTSASIACDIATLYVALLAPL